MSAHLNEVVHEESNVVSATEVLFQKLQAAAQSGKSENIGTIIELAKQVRRSLCGRNEVKRQKSAGLTFRYNSQLSERKVL